MQRALAAIEVFAHFCRRERARGATRSTRSRRARSATPTNADEFLDRARPRPACAVRVLSREEEARYGYLAAVNSTTLVRRRRARPRRRLDAARARRQRGSRRELDSWPLGAVRMTERFLADDEPRQAQAAARAAGARRVQARRAPWAGAAPARGSSASAARCATSPPPRSARPAGRRVRRPGLHRSRATRSTSSSRSSPSCRPPSAAGVAGHQAGARRPHPRRARSWSQRRPRRRRLRRHRGHRGGPARGRLLRALPRARRPPLFDDVRRASVVNLAAQYECPTTTRTSSTSPTRARALRRARSRRRAPRRPGRARAAVGGGDAARHRHDDRLRRPPQALALPHPQRGPARLRAREVALIAQAVRYHRKGMPVARRRSPALADRATRTGSRALRALLRLAEDLERSRDQLVRDAHVALDDGDVRLDLVADGDARSRAGPPRARASSSTARSAAGSSFASEPRRLRPRSGGRGGGERRAVGVERVHVLAHGAIRPSRTVNTPMQ